MNIKIYSYFLLSKTMLRWKSYVNLCEYVCLFPCYVIPEMELLANSHIQVESIGLWRVRVYSDLDSI